MNSKHKALAKKVGGLKDEKGSQIYRKVSDKPKKVEGLRDAAGHQIYRK